MKTSTRIVLPFFHALMELMLTIAKTILKNTGKRNKRSSEMQP